MEQICKIQGDANAKLVRHFLEVRGFKVTVEKDTSKKTKKDMLVIFVEKNKANEARKTLKENGLG